MSRIACLAAAAGLFSLFLTPGRLLAVVVPPNNSTLAYNAATETQAAASATAWNPHVNTTSLTRNWPVGAANQPTLVTSGVFSWDQPGIVAAYEWDSTDSSGTADQFFQKHKPWISDDQCPTRIGAAPNISRPSPSSLAWAA